MADRLDIREAVPNRPADIVAMRRRHALIGLPLALSILTGWVALHVFAVFFYSWQPLSWLTAPLLAALICWLYVGLFIVAHDCMHGSLVPGWPALNRRIGQFCLVLYAGFDFDKLNRCHHMHHRHAGTAGDPDFDERPPHGFFRWYLKFLVEYFSWRQMLFMAVVGNVYMYALGASVANLIVFWAVPAILSSMQLFLFGTYLPHKPGADTFTDRHRTRSTKFGWWLSLITCFHFGYHHEHHEHPDLPWWRLPEAHR